MGAAAVVLLWAVLASEVAEAAVVWAAAVSAGVRLTEYAFSCVLPAANRRCHFPLLRQAQLPVP